MNLPYADKVLGPTADGMINLLDALQCGAALIDREGVLVHVNPRLCEIAGHPRADMVGQPLSSFYHEAYAQIRLDEIMSHFDEPTEGEFHFPRPDGTRVPLMFAGRPLRADRPSQPAHYRVVTAIEITEQKRAYDEVTRLGDTVLEQALELKHLNQNLEERVRQRTQELHTANMASITMLAVASEARDEDTGAHVRRIEAAARLLAEAAGHDSDEAQQIGYSAILHDVGKIHIPDHILKKPGPLTVAERREMQEHTLIGEQILSDQPFFETARVIARSHHENWDGSGYPDGLAGASIPMPARIVHLVDVYDALTSKRVYKDAWDPAAAAAEIRGAAGRMFDPELVDQFGRLHAAGRFHELAMV